MGHYLITKDFLLDAGFKKDNNGIYYHTYNSSDGTIHSDVQVSFDETKINVEVRVENRKDCIKYQHHEERKTFSVFNLYGLLLSVDASTEAALVYNTAFQRVADDISYMKARSRKENENCFTNNICDFVCRLKGTLEMKLDRLRHLF